MKFEEPELMQTTVNTVVYSETQLVELSSGHGTGPFWDMFRPSCMSLEMTRTITTHPKVNWKELESGKLWRKKKRTGAWQAREKKKNLLIYTHIRIKRYIQVGTMGRKPGV